MKMTKNEQILEIWNRRYACKKFSTEKRVSKEDFETILESGRLSQTSFGLEGWKALIIRNEGMREDFKEFCWGGLNSLNGATEFVVLLAKKGLVAGSEHMNHIHDIKGLPEEMRELVRNKFSDFQKNHLNLLENERTLFDWTSKQTYIVMANMMATATFLGIDNCAIEGFNKNKVEKYLEEKGLIDLNEWGVSVMVSFGYKDEEITPKKRREVAEIYKIVE